LTPCSFKYSVRSSAIRLVSVVTNTRSLAWARSRISDSKSSIIDPEKWKAYVASSGPAKNLGQQIVNAADAYRTTGSREAAECAIHHMEAAAKDRVFTGKMSSNQAYYVQGWVIGAVAISYLKVRDSGLILPQQKHDILPWIVEVVQQTMNYYDTRRQKETGDAQNNHLYWAGVEASAAGVAANNRQLFDWGMDTYRAGVTAIESDGTLPLEMKRGQRALHYHLFAVSPLVYLAEFGEDNGLKLYADHNYAIKKLAVLSTQGLITLVKHAASGAAAASVVIPIRPPCKTSCLNCSDRVHEPFAIGVCKLHPSNLLPCINDQSIRNLFP